MLAIHAIQAYDHSFIFIRASKDGLNDLIVAQNTEIVNKLKYSFSIFNIFLKYCKR